MSSPLDGHAASNAGERSEREKMLIGDPYNPTNPELVRLRSLARQMTRAFNSTIESDGDTRRALLNRLLGAMGPRIEIEPPLRCDYGFNLYAGDGFFANFGCVFLDSAPIRFGSDVKIGPNCGFYTVDHPLDPGERRAGLETARPITIGDDVWLGGGVIVLGGVTIGEGAVIGAGSVVTRDVPPRVVAAGNPCRVLRDLDSGPRVIPI